MIALFAFAAFKNKKAQLTVFVVIMVILIVFRSFLMRELFSLFEQQDSHYIIYQDEETALSIIGLLMQVSLFVFCCIFYREDTIGLIFLGFSCCFQYYATGASGVASMFRIGLYFLNYSCVFISNAISASFDKERLEINAKSKKKIYEFVIALLFIVYFIISTINARNIYPYKFFF